MNFRVTWKDHRLIYPGKNPQQNLPTLDISNETTSNPPTAQATANTVEYTAVSTEVLKSIWVPDPFFRRTRDLKMFRLLQDVQGVFLYSDGTVYTSMVLVLVIYLNIDRLKITKTLPDFSL